jgi:hypothetical protein
MLCKDLDLFCIAYIDDIVVYSHWLEEHREHIGLIFAKPQKAGLKLKWSKCEFEMHRIIFVGFVVMPESV